MENIYNGDEKGFLTGLCQAVKRIITKEAYDSGRVNANRQDGSRKFISLLATICADNTKLPPALIYKGKTGALQNTWMQDVKKDEEVYFAASTNGWSSNAFELHYLTKVFDPHIKAKAKRGKKLLIVDGHSSHVNMAFLEQCDKLRISESEAYSMDKKKPPTPHSAKAFKHFSQEYKRNPTKTMLRKLFKAAEQASAEHAIAEYRAAGLREALQLEKSKRQRSKKLNLLGEVANGGA